MNRKGEKFVVVFSPNQNVNTISSLDRVPLKSVKPLHRQEAAAG
jgi:hypothetical protein